jgi:hypothetical protein
MMRCPTCDYPLPPDRERLGARCPHCRDPLYEPAGRTSRAARADEGTCALHPGREAVGTCGRCGTYFCQVCRTRWRDQVWCIACVERALEERGAIPERARSHFRQAVSSLVLGGSAWVLLVAVQVIGAFLLKDVPILTLLVLLLVLTAFVLGLAGLGQATAALRVRGNHMILATLGLIVSGLYVGVFIGLFTFFLWST